MPELVKPLSTDGGRAKVLWSWTPSPRVRKASCTFLILVRFTATLAFKCDVQSRSSAARKGESLPLCSGLVNLTPSYWKRSALASCDQEDRKPIKRYYVASIVANFPAVWTSTSYWTYFTERSTCAF